ncbi:MAG: hypothetical protein H0T84_07685 [Tatlockia sp.]|nr:hypothetical protein [Tatlockia sp.]
MVNSFNNATLSFAAIPANWEAIKAPWPGIGYTYIYRLPVPGGWLVYTHARHDSSASALFIPDVNHEWVLEK